MTAANPKSSRNLLIVLAVIGSTVALVIGLVVIGGAVAAGAIHDQGEHAQAAVSRTDAASVRSAAVLWLMEQPGEDCPSVAELALGGFLDPSRPRADAWGREFRIDCAADDVRVSSAGPDGVHGNGDDISP